MTIALLLAFISATETFDLPKGLLSAVCFVESSHRTNALHVEDGNGNSLGECQLKLATAKLMGFKGTERDLVNDYTLNIHYAAKYLKTQLVRYNGDSTKAIAAYNAGTHKLDKKGHIKNHKYVDKVLKAWKEQR